MSARSGFAALLLGLPAILTAGCAGSSAPAGWLETPSKTQSQAYGAWAEVQYKMKSSQKKLTISGELIAFEEDSVFVLTDSLLAGVPSPDIVKVKLVGYDSKAGLLAVWTWTGTLATISHGILLIFSAPTWIIGGSIATAGQSRAPIKRFPDKPPEELRAYARFPQGLPPDLDRKTLRPKSVSENK